MNCRTYCRFLYLSCFVTKPVFIQSRWCSYSLIRDGFSSPEIMTAFSERDILLSKDHFGIQRGFEHSFCGLGCCFLFWSVGGLLMCPGALQALDILFSKFYLSSLIEIIFGISSLSCPLFPFLFLCRLRERPAV